MLGPGAIQPRILIARISLPRKNVPQHGEVTVPVKLNVTVAEKVHPLRVRGYGRVPTIMPRDPE